MLIPVRDESGLRTGIWGMTLILFVLIAACVRCRFFQILNGGVHLVLLLFDDLFDGDLDMIVPCAGSVGHWYNLS